MTAENSATPDHLLVPLLGRDLEDATRILSRIVRARERWWVLEGARRIDPSREETVDDDPREVLAHQMFACARARSELLPEEVSGEPSWHVLLTLYLAKKSRARHTVSSIVGFSRSSQTTALRHIDALEKAGFVRRQQDKTDRRVYYLLLTANGATVVEKVLTHALEGVKNATK